jgi:adenosylhomocysteine nucleosidase
MEEINLIIAAMDSEVDAILETVKDYEETTLYKYKAYKFNRNGEDYYLVTGEIGKVATAIKITALSLNYKIKRVFNLGTSGSVSKDVTIDTVIIATKVGYHDVDVQAFNYKLGQIPGGDPELYECDNEWVEKHLSKVTYPYLRGVVRSGDQFITKENYPSTNLPKFDDVLTCEMESGAVGQTCYTLKIPFVVIRSISDSVLVDDNKTTHDEHVASSMKASALVLLQMI